MVDIPQTDPYANYCAHKDDINVAITRVLDSGRYIMGEEVLSFEKEFSEYVGVNYAAGVASGTDALELALRACGVGDDTIVFTVSHTAVATVAAIERTGAEAILIDIDPDTYNMDVKCLETAVADSYDGHATAIVPVHIYGHPADMASIRQIADNHELFVVEDCAQAHGASIDARRVGTWGHMAAFSFYPTKNLGALGDAGAVVTDDLSLIEKVRSLREYGWTERYVSDIPGINSRMDPLQAAILRIKLTGLDAENKQRRTHADRYHKMFYKESVEIPYVQPGVQHVYHQYVIRTPKRDELRKYLLGRGIGTGIHYPVPVHKQPAYRGRVGFAGNLIHTEAVANSILSLPMYPELSSIEIDRVVDNIINSPYL
jgi:dTDP-4-amino-4,6-dideoxygalactose transaminase